MRTRRCWPGLCRILGGGTDCCESGVGSGGRGRRPREGNDERVDELNGQGNDQGMGANGGVEGVNGNVERANGGAPDFSTIIAQQLQNLLPAMLAQENMGNVLVNGNRVGCSYKEFLACNPKEYDGKGGVVVLTRWIEKMESVHDMSGCSIDQKVIYTAGSFVVMRCKSWNLSCGITHVGAGLCCVYDRFHELARLVPHLAKKIKLEFGVLDPSVPPTTPTMYPVDLGRHCFICNRAWELAGYINPTILLIIERQLVEIDKVIKRCKLEIEGHVFDIDLIPFGHGSFDVIIGMDWFSNYKAEIIFHEKVVRIPLPDGKVLRVVRERPEEKARLLMSAKASDKK
ncbi:putative reverse transcriptase domain-containing protein [Tanacetum coccineum]